LLHCIVCVVCFIMSRGSNATNFLFTKPIAIIIIRFCLNSTEIVWREKFEETKEVIKNLTSKKPKRQSDILHRRNQRGNQKTYIEEAKEVIRNLTSKTRRPANLSLFFGVPLDTQYLAAFSWNIHTICIFDIHMFLGSSHGMSSCPFSFCHCISWPSCLRCKISDYLFCFFDDQRINLTLVLLRMVDHLF
jgi:hypothetical protein